MQVQVVHPLDFNDSDLAHWEALQLIGDDLISPFLTPAYAIALGRIYDNVRVAVVEEAGKACGYFPFSVGAGSVATTMAMSDASRPKPFPVRSGLQQSLALTTPCTGRPDTGMS